MSPAALAGLFLAAAMAGSFSTSVPAKGGEAAPALISKAMEAERLPSLSVAIGRGGRVLFSEARGLADLENAVQATSGSAYRIGSVTKTLTSTLALRLAEEERFDLDAPIERFCAAFPSKPFRVTPRLLLAHLGGIRDYDARRFREEFFSAKRYATAPEAVAIFKDDSLASPP